MDAQPVALATCARSPNNCDSSFRYGVSPQPAQAPEKVNSGSRNCTPRTLAKSTRLRSFTGSVVAKSRFARASSISPSLSAIASDFAGSVGQASTHREQPVQSSSENDSVNRTSGNPRTLIGADRNDPGADWSLSAPK